MANLSQLEQEIAAKSSVKESVELLVTKIAEEIDEARNDPARLQAACQQLRNDAAALGTCCESKLKNDESPSDTSPSEPSSPRSGDIQPDSGGDKTTRP